MKKYIGLSFLSLSFFLSPLFLFAQDTTNTPTSCFDYYHFGSISADLQANITATVSGVPVTFQGNIINNNDYPVVNGTLYAKIFRVPTGGKDVNGPYVLDQFVIKQGIDLPAKGSVPVTYVWKVPSYVVSGEYKIATYYISDNKFNLLGLSFTNDIIGNSYSFKVKAEQNTTVELDKNTVTINDGEYHFAAFSPRISKDEQGVVKANVINTTKQDQVVPITYKVYSWDAQSEQNLLDTKTEDITVKAGKTQSILYTVTDTNHPVYLVEITSTYKDTKSILNIRFVRQGVDQPRINFPAVTSYPLVAGQANTLFSCFHNAAENTVKDGKLILSVKDIDNKTLYTTTYEGDITGAMMATKLDFIPKKTLNTFSVIAELYSGNKLVDSANMKYDCKTLNPSSCPKESTSLFGDSFNKTGTAIISIVILILIALSALFLKKKKMWVILFLLITSSSFFVGGGKADASVTWSATYGHGYNDSIIVNYFDKIYSKIKPSIYMEGYATLGNPAITVSYDGQVIDPLTGENIQGSSTIPINKEITFRFKAHKAEDVTWVATGTWWDSPYGDWAKNGTSTPSSISCNANDLVSTSYGYDGGQYYNYGASGQNIEQWYFPFVVNPPSKTLSNTQGLKNCSLPVTNQDGTVDVKCTVATSTGPVSADMNFGNTEGRYYFRVGMNARTYSNVLANWCSESDLDSNGWCCLGTNKPAVKSVYYNQDFVLNVPTQTIPFSFTGGLATNLPPTAPVVDGPTGSSVDISNNFNFVSTDPDNDTLRYGIDWDTTDGVDNVDQWIPGSGYVASGITQYVSKSWSVAGSKTFKVLAQDSKGATSPWTLHSISICSSGNKYCSTTNSCILNASCCGGCSAPQSCVVGGTGYGACEDPAPTCSLPTIIPTITPSFVSDPTKTCTLKWNVNSTLQSGTGLCTAGIKCYVDNTNQTTSSSTGVSLPVGTHSLSCGSDLTGTSTVSVKCRVSPGYGEF